MPTALRTLGVPTVFDEWRDLPALVGLAWALTALGGTCLGGAWGERWHTRLRRARRRPHRRSGEPAERAAAGARLKGDSGMVDVGERLGTPAVTEDEPVEGATEQEPAHTP